MRRHHTPVLTQLLALAILLLPLAVRAQGILGFSDPGETLQAPVEGPGKPGLPVPRCEAQHEPVVAQDELVYRLRATLVEADRILQEIVNGPHVDDSLGEASESLRGLLLMAHLQFVKLRGGLLELPDNYLAAYIELHSMYVTLQEWGAEAGHLEGRVQPLDLAGLPTPCRDRAAGMAGIWIAEAQARNRRAGTRWEEFRKLAPQGEEGEALTDMRRAPTLRALFASRSEAAWASASLEAASFLLGSLPEGAVEPELAGAHGLQLMLTQQASTRVRMVLLSHADLVKAPPQ